MNEFIKHPDSWWVIFGRRLVAGEELRDSDFYSSTTGKWEPCPCVGCVVGPNNVVWVRVRE